MVRLSTKRWDSPVEILFEFALTGLSGELPALLLLDSSEIRNRVISIVVYRTVRGEAPNGDLEEDEDVLGTAQVRGHELFSGKIVDIMPSLNELQQEALFFERKQEREEQAKRRSAASPILARLEEIKALRKKGKKKTRAVIRRPQICFNARSMSIVCGKLPEGLIPEGQFASVEMAAVDPSSGILQPICVQVMHSSAVEMIAHTAALIGKEVCISILDPDGNVIARSVGPANDANLLNRPLGPDGLPLPLTEEEFEKQQAKAEAEALALQGKGVLNLENQAAIFNKGVLNLVDQDGDVVVQVGLNGRIPEEINEPLLLLISVRNLRTVEERAR
jgi:hypothetical protein